MEFFKPGRRFKFMSKAKLCVGVSAALVLASWVLVLTKGLNFGIDFVGGTEALLAFNTKQDVAKVREAVEATGLDAPEVVTYGLNDEGRYFVRSRTQSLLTQAEKDAVKKAVTEQVGAPTLFDDNDVAGEEIRVRFEGAKDEELLKKALASAGFADSSISRQSEGVSPVYILRLPGVKDRIIKQLKATFGDQFKSVDRMESVGSAVGKQMRDQGALAVLYALIMILFYIAFRFDLRYSPGAVIALFHDVSLTLGAFSLLGMEFNLPIIAALLALVGYSLNDTIVVYDRIRENINLKVTSNLADNIDISISDTLSRTVLTSGTTLLACVAIYVFGGGMIEGFAFAMTFGIFVGTYSSIFIASPLIILLDKVLKRKPAASIPA